ncbi:hypothetical protein [Sphingomonas insulae]|uniref:hypothetical protein n=1 Tax=Sphingomonas insulae TaxID=424800 RepID=UPI00141AB988|nr:hypothetical protein [Sphingomonas insulae]
MATFTVPARHMVIPARLSGCATPVQRRTDFLIASKFAPSSRRRWARNWVFETLLLRRETLIGR